MTTRTQPARTILTRCPVVPVVVLDDPALAAPLGEALPAGGIDIVEIAHGGSGRRPGGAEGGAELNSA